MVKSPPNATNNNVWKEVVYHKRNKGKARMQRDLAAIQEEKGKKKEGFKTVMVKKEEMTKAMMARKPSPKRKRDPHSEVIVLSDDSESKMDIDTDIEKDEDNLVEDSSEEDSVLKKLPTPKKKKGRNFVDFMAALDSDEEDEDMLLEPNDQDSDKEDNEPTNTEIVKLDAKSNDSNDCDEKVYEDQDSNDDSFWTEDEVQLATALWNEVNLKEVFQVKGRWNHMYSGRSAPLRDPSSDFIADAVDANKGRKGKDLINPWQRKIPAKEPKLLQLQKERAEQLEKNKGEEGRNKTPSRWKEQIKKSIEKGSSLKQPKDNEERSTPKKTLVKTMFSANQQWLNQAESVAKSATAHTDKETPPQKKIGSGKTSATKITNHFQTSKVTPASTTSENKKGANPYKTSTKDKDIQKTGNAVAQAIQDEENPQQQKTQTKMDKIFPHKHDVSFADAMKGHTFERVMRKYTRRLAVSFNVTIKIEGTNDGENQEKAL